MDVVLALLFTILSIIGIGLFMSSWVKRKMNADEA